MITFFKIIHSHAKTRIFCIIVITNSQRIFCIIVITIIISTAKTCLVLTVKHMQQYLLFLPFMPFILFYCDEILYIYMYLVTIVLHLIFLHLFQLYYATTCVELLEICASLHLE